MNQEKNTVDYSDILIAIDSGNIRGLLADEVYQWRNIPYAQPPVGDLRWQQPVAVEPWTELFDATVAERIFIQPHQTKLNLTTIGDEQCLTINIYRRGQPHNKLLPVLFYIHGGNNQLGQPSEFSSIEVAKKLDCVLVTINYRLGALGFNPLTCLKTDSPSQSSGNFALLDIEFALKWIHRNIKKFAGDPTNITACGFSSGGRNVMTMLISPLFKDLFHRAIVFSGGMTTTDRLASADIFSDHFSVLVVEDKVKKDRQTAKAWLLSNKPDVKQYLLNLSAQRVALAFEDANIRMDNFPHLYRDGYVIPNEGFDTEHYYDVPVMLFSGVDEFSLFLNREAYFNQIINDHNKTDATLHAQYDYCFKYGGLLYSVFNTSDSATIMSSKTKRNANIYIADIRYGSDEYNQSYNYSPYLSFHGIFLALWDPQCLRALFHFKDDNIDKSTGHSELTSLFNHYINQFIQTGSPNDDHVLQWQPWTDENINLGQSILVLDCNENQAISYMTNKNISLAALFELMQADNSIDKNDKLYLYQNILNGRWWSRYIDNYIDKLN